ncbi:MAG: restriction endonuclease subunit S [Hyphomicrobium sp.]|uniref:restriction endonuclease subunit S n=1 Tax=Hyphomicrobium sp. TaxID=82 RepID=UPI0025C65651|nr:restriction endonuclease subunit S [Hyphomicrobium sp.]MBX9864865.1 restriction endonuclease subunit S [Hyphomicrobium sp.]
MRLADACTIHTGYTARGRLEPTTVGGVLAIQLRDISPDGLVDPERLTRVQLEDLADRYFVRAGDVVFRSRGERNTASALDERLREPALAVLPLMVLRPNRNVVTPAYLAWAINQPPAQRHFDIAARGTNIRMIPRSSLDDLELDVPDIETQERIVVIDALAERERELTQLAAETRRKMMSLILVERASRMRPKTRQERTSK